MQDNDARATTIGQYFTALLHALFTETEGFSGKRPFGNSGWDQDIDKALIRADAIWGSFDEDGYIEDYDSAAASAIVFDTIAFLSKADWTTLSLPPKPKDWAVIALSAKSGAVVHHLETMLDEASAEEMVETYNLSATDWVWHAIRIPK